MIDKIETAFPPGTFTVGPDAPFLIQSTHSSRDGETEDGPLFAQGGRLLYGRSAVLKTGQDTDRFFCGVDCRGLKVSFNPGSLFTGGENFHGTDFPGVRRSVEFVQDRLTACGVGLNLSGSRLTRLDLERTREMVEPVFTYGPVFGSLHGRRMRAVEHAGETFRFSNSKREIQFYDKSADALDKGYTPPVGNWMRCEIKARKAPAVPAMFGIERIGDITEDWHEHARTEIYPRIIRDTFHMTSEQLQFDFTNELETFKRFRERFPRGSFTRYLLARGSAQEFIVSIGGADNLRTFLENAGYHRTTTWRIVNELTDIISIGVQVDEDRAFQKRLSELREKFAA